MQREDIFNQKFKRSFYGYDGQEVDAFLDEIIAELARREEEQALMVRRVEALLERLDELEEPAQAE